MTHLFLRPFHVATSIFRYSSVRATLMVASINQKPDQIADTPPGRNCCNAGGVYRTWVCVTETIRGTCPSCYFHRAQESNAGIVANSKQSKRQYQVDGDNNKKNKKIRIL